PNDPTSLLRSRFFGDHRPCFPDLQFAGYDVRQAAFTGRRSEAPPVGAEQDIVDGQAVPAESQQFLTEDRIPDPDRLIEAGRSEPLAVRAEADTTHEPTVPGERLHLPAGRRVPDLDHPVLAGGSEEPTVRAEGYTEHPGGVTEEGMNSSARRRIPDRHPL